MESGKPLLVEDVTKTDIIKPSGWKGYKDSSFLVFPILDSFGKTAGILTLHSKKDPPFIEQDKEIGTILASCYCETLWAIWALKALQKTEKQYRTLFEKTNDAIFIIDKTTGRYLNINKAAAELTGRTLEELKQLTIHDVIPEYAEKQTLAIAESDGTRAIETVTYHRPDNTCRVARVSTLPLDDIAEISIAKDITHDLEVEKQLRHSHKMEAIGTLAGGIAHDFNNILSGIIGYAQLAKLDLDDPEKTKKNIDQVLKGAQRASGLIQQILTFSRHTECKKNPLKLFLIVKEAVKFLRSSIPASIKIEEKVISRAMVLADPTQIHQIVMNLCTNAYHAMCNSGGILTVKLTEVEILPQDPLLGNTYMPGNYVKLEVQDTGHGMDKKILERIFDPYFTTKQADKGTGLGLAVVDGIVKSHDGFIKVYSEPGHGSTFQVFLSVVEKQSSLNNTDKNKAGLPKGTEQIMLVDDEKSILNTLQAILERQGYKIAAFKDGRSALYAFTKDPGRFDLVITDMTMPEMTGNELSARILNIRKDVPIILCTGYSETFTENMALKIGIRRYVQKPVASRRLTALIRELLDESRTESEV
jgi:PAS domain S-box-containing protein